jgi:hypothetical protein
MTQANSHTRPIRDPRNKRPYDPSKTKPSISHPVRGFYNYIVGQLATNPNFFMSTEESDELTDDVIQKDVDKIIRTAKALCDGTHDRNKERYEEHSTG